MLFHLRGRSKENIVSGTVHFLIPLMNAIISVDRYNRLLMMAG
jgi:hypothetical protein